MCIAKRCFFTICEADTDDALIIDQCGSNFIRLDYLDRIQSTGVFPRRLGSVSGRPKRLSVRKPRSNRIFPCLRSRLGRASRWCIRSTNIWTSIRSSSAAARYIDRKKGGVLSSAPFSSTSHGSLTAVVRRCPGCYCRYRYCHCYCLHAPGFAAHCRPHVRYRWQRPRAFAHELATR